MNEEVNEIKLHNELKNKVINSEKWNEELNKIKIPRTDMNMIVLNYLIIEGHKDAAEKFIKESEYDEKLLEERMRIRTLILCGRIDEAINQINEINPEILEINPTIHFELQKQKLIEIIKRNKIEEAITFSQNKLFPLTMNNPGLFAELEKIMVLLAYDDISKSPYKELGTDEQLKKLSSLVNYQILQTQMQPTDLVLPTVLKLLMYSQNQLKKELSFPELISVCPLKFTTPEGKDK